MVVELVDARSLQSEGNIFLAGIRIICFGRTAYKGVIINEHQKQVITFLKD